jgi:WD40 repeat protein
MLYDSTTFQLQHTLTGHGSLGATEMAEDITSCSFAPDGTTILSSSSDFTMKLWSAATGQHLRTLAGHSGLGYVGSFRSCCFAPSGHDIYSASNDGTLMVWKTATGQLDGIIDKDRNTPFSICASTDGKYTVSCHIGGVVKMWRVG